VSEIENHYNDQIDAREKESESDHSPGAISRPNHQLSYSMTDKAIFKDITRVVFSFLDRQGGSDNKSDRGKIRTFMKMFIPLCFGVQDIVPENLLREDDDDDEDDEPMDDDDETRSVNSYESDGDVSRSPSSRKRGKRGRSARREDDGGPSDLLRDVLTRKTKETNHARSRSGSPSSDEAIVKHEDTEGDVEKNADTANAADTEVNGKAAEVNEAVGLAKRDAEVNGTEHVPMETVTNEDHHILAQAAAATAPIARKRTVFSLFCNNSFYVFFRQYQVCSVSLYRTDMICHLWPWTLINSFGVQLMYERLVKMKELSEQMEADPKRSRKLNKTAIELGIQYTRFDGKSPAQPRLKCI
jgi:paired amphipathic helix protein Sin3a